MIEEKTSVRLEKGSLKRLIEQVVEDRDLRDGTLITPSSILHRHKRGKLVTTRTTGGLYSPLLDMEPAIVNMELHYRQMRQLLHYRQMHQLLHYKQMRQ